jgi:hypothetical protein
MIVRITIAAASGEPVKIAGPLLTSGKTRTATFISVTQTDEVRKGGHQPSEERRRRERVRGRR